ncbi:hypothetical protein CK803_11870 [Brucella abortus]|nr:hypothetical protein CK803_11870 [Brucella abortus]
MRRFIAYLIPFFLTVLVIGVIMAVLLVPLALMQDNPAAILKTFFLGPFGSIRHMGNVVEAATPIMLTGLAITILFRSGLFNLGAESGFFLGALGAVAGSFACTIPAALRLRFGASEMVTSLVLNYAFLFLGLFVLNYVIRDPNAGGMMSLRIPADAKLDRLLAGTRLNSGSIIAVLACIAGGIWLYWTRSGLNIRIAGSSPGFANHLGLPLKGIIMRAQIVGGLVAGMAGALKSGALPSLAVPFIGNIHVLTFAALLAVPAVSLLMMRTRFGLHLRATGVDPKSARAAGIQTGRVQMMALILYGLFGGAAGAYLSLGYVTWFAQNMTAGRGFIAIAAEVMGQGTAWGTLVASLVLAAAESIAITLQSLGLPFELMQMIPYLVPVIVLTVHAARASGAHGGRSRPRHKRHRRRHDSAPLLSKHAVSCAIPSQRTHQETTMARKIIIDTDPGQDDAVAILLALASPELDILGITAVAGNGPLARTEVNARTVCEVAKKPDTKVFAGSIRPLVRPLVTAENVHGKTGLDGYDLPAPTMPLQAQHGVDFIIETLMKEEPGTVTLCPIGPLTNIASALIRESKIAGRVKEIVLMGGGYFEGGNITPSAEFNIYVDPHAASVVFSSGIKITMLPLDVTHKVLTTEKRIAAIRNIGSHVGEVVAAWLEFFERYDEAKYGTDGAPLHDPNVIAYLIKPELYSGRACNVEIEINSELTIGETVVDWWEVTDRPKNAFFIKDVDADGFFSLLTERLATL